MTFKELKKGFPVFIFNKGDLTYVQRKTITDATPPRINTVFGQPMIVDVSIESEGIWTLPADQQLAERQSDSNIIITTDKSLLVNIVKAIETECEAYLQAVPTYNKKLELAKNLASELDVTYKQQQQTEQRSF